MQGYECLSCRDLLRSPPRSASAAAQAHQTQVYLNCAAALGVDPQRCVALEDSVNGMIASKAARMRSIVVPEAENSRDPRFALADVKLPSLLALTAENLLG